MGVSKKNKELIDDLYFDYYRMSSSGKATLDYIADIKALTVEGWSTSLVKKLIEDLYFDWDRLSSGGQETLDKIADRFGV